MARIEIKLPKMGESVLEGTIVEWMKQVGDVVEEDETLVEIGTDKVDSEVPAPVAGRLVEIKAQKDDVCAVDSVIAIIETDVNAPSISSQDIPEKEIKPPISKDTKPPQEPSIKEEIQNKAIPDKDEKTKSTFYSPLIRSIAKKENISDEQLQTIKGTGKEGRLTKQDLMNYISNLSSPQKSPSLPTPSDDALVMSNQKNNTISAGELTIERPKESVKIIKMDRMRKMIAEHMVRSKHTSAHVTTFAEADVTNIVKWRNANKNVFYEEHNVKLTFTPIFLRAIIHVLGSFPLLNSSIEKDEIHIKKDIHFGIAVALGQSGKGGLIVPVIHNAQDKNLIGLTKSVAQLAKKARDKKLEPDDLVGGTMTLTNYGSTGNLMGTPIINQPQVAIIGTGAIQKKVAVITDSNGDDTIAIRDMMYLSLSYDHRIIDGAHGGAFLGAVRRHIETLNTQSL